MCMCYTVYNINAYNVVKTIESAPRLRLYPLVSFPALSLGQELVTAKTVLGVESARSLISVRLGFPNDDEYCGLMAVIRFCREFLTFARAMNLRTRLRNVSSSLHAPHARLTTDDALNSIQTHITIEHTRDEDNVNPIESFNPIVVGLSIITDIMYSTNMSRLSGFEAQISGEHHLHCNGRELISVTE